MDCSQLQSTTASHAQSDIVDPNFVCYSHYFQGISPQAPRARCISPLQIEIVLLLLLLLLLLLKKVGSSRLRESDIHSISPKTSSSQYQPIDRKKRKGKRVEDYSRDRAAYPNKKKHWPCS